MTAATVASGPPPVASTVIGLKIALTSAAAQRRLHTDRPVWGWLTASMGLPSGSAVACPPGYRTRVEPEIVFVLGEDLAGPGVSRHDVLSATAALCAGLELPQVTDDATFADADAYRDANAGAHLVITGTPTLQWRHLDLALLGVLVDVDGVPVASGAGAAVLGHPAEAIAQVVNALAEHGSAGLAEHGGAGLRRGMQIFTGGMCEPVTLTPGVSVGARFAHLGHLDVVGVAHDPEVVA